MGMGISGQGGAISGIQQGQGFLGNFDANGNLIPGTGGVGNPNGPTQTPGTSTPGTLMPGPGGGGGPIYNPIGIANQNGNPTGPATNPGTSTPGTSMPGTGGKGGMPQGPAMPGGGGNTSLGGTSVPVQQPAPIGVQQGGTPGRPSPAFPFTPRGPGYANPGGQGVQQQAPQQAPQQMPLTGNFQPHVNSPHPINPFNQGWNQMGQGMLQPITAPMNVTGPAIPTGPIPNTNFGGLLKGMRR